MTREFHTDLFSIFYVYFHLVQNCDERTIAQ